MIRAPVFAQFYVFSFIFLWLYFGTIVCKTRLCYCDQPPPPKPSLFYHVSGHFRSNHHNCKYQVVKVSPGGSFAPLHSLRSLCPPPFALFTPICPFTLFAPLPPSLPLCSFHPHHSLRPFCSVYPLCPLLSLCPFAFFAPFAPLCSLHPLCSPFTPFANWGCLKLTEALEANWTPKAHHHLLKWRGVKWVKGLKGSEGAEGDQRGEWEQRSLYPTRFLGPHHLLKLRGQREVKGWREQRGKRSEGEWRGWRGAKVIVAYQVLDPHHLEWRGKEGEESEDKAKGTNLLPHLVLLSPPPMWVKGAKGGWREQRGSKGCEKGVNGAKVLLQWVLGFPLPGVRTTCRGKGGQRVSKGSKGKQREQREAKGV